MRVPEWMDENVAFLWHSVSRLQIMMKMIADCLRDTDSRGFERADGKRYQMSVKGISMPVSDLKNKHTVYYRQKRSYYNIRPSRKIPRLENDFLF